MAPDHLERTPGMGWQAADRFDPLLRG